MSSAAELLNESENIGELFAALHSQADDIAESIAVFDPDRVSPDRGELYSHRESWKHPYHQVPVTGTHIRIAKENYTAPYLMEVWSLKSPAKTDTSLPCKIKTFSHLKGNEVEIDQLHLGGLIEVTVGPVYDQDGEDLQG